MTPELALILVGLLANRPAHETPADDWRQTTVIEEADLVVRINVRARPSLADTDWMVLEFENRSGQPLTLDNPHYSMDSERGPLGADEPSLSGGLASGSPYDLFPHAGTTHDSPIVLRPHETYRLSDQPSDSSAALLGLATPPGTFVRARISLTVNIGRDGSFRLARARVPFTFDWMPPDENGFKALRGRLVRLLQAPQSKAHYAYILETYLDIPDVAKVATVDALLEALDIRHHDFDGRSAIAKHVAHRFPRHPAVIAFVRERLRRGDARVLDDLRAPKLWDPSLVEPLVERYEAGPDEFHDALTCLHVHQADWITRRDVIRRLSAAVHREHPRMRDDVRELKDGALDDWEDAIEDLSMTGDTTAIAWLSPALDDTRAFRTSAGLALVAAFSPPPPLRVCDVALEAILTLLDGSPDAAYGRAGRPTDGRATIDKAYTDLRDRMILELKERLAATRRE